MTIYDMSLPGLIVLIIVVSIVFTLVGLFGNEIFNRPLDINPDDTEDEISKKINKRIEKEQRMHKALNNINSAFESWWLPVIVMILFSFFALAYAVSIGADF